MANKEQQFDKLILTLSNHDLDERINILEEARKTYPENLSKICFELGKVYEEIAYSDKKNKSFFESNMNKALEEYSKSVAASSNDNKFDDAFIAKVKCLYKMEKNEEAFKQLNTYVASGKIDRKERLPLLVQAKKYDEAINDIDWLLNHEKQKELLRKKEYEEYLKKQGGVLSKDSGEPQQISWEYSLIKTSLHEQKAKLHAKLGDFSAAEKEFDNAIATCQQSQKLSKFIEENKLEKESNLKRLKEEKEKYLSTKD